MILALALWLFSWKVCRRNSSRVDEDLKNSPVYCSSPCKSLIFVAPQCSEKFQAFITNSTFAINSNTTFSRPLFRFSRGSRRFRRHFLQKFGKTLAHKNFLENISKSQRCSIFDFSLFTKTCKKCQNQYHMIFHNKHNF